MRRQSHLLLLVALLSSCTRHDGVPSADVVLDADYPVASLTPGIVVELPFKSPGVRLISVTQEHADVQVRVTGASAATTEFDSPARRAAVERACVFSAAGPLSLRIASKDARAAEAALFHVRVLAMDGSDLDELPPAMRTECSEGEAARLPADWSESVATERARVFVKAAQFWKAAGDPARAAAAYLQAGWMLARRTSNPVEALAQGRKARDAYQLARDPIGEARALLQMTVPLWVLTESGRDEQGRCSNDAPTWLARTQLEIDRAITTFDAAGDAYFSAEARGHLGYNYYELGQYTDAMRAFTDAADRFRKAGEREGENRALANFYEVLKLSGNYREAAAAFDRLVASRSDSVNDGALADILNNSAATHSAAGDFDRALPQFVRALQIHEANRDFAGMARSLNGLSATYMRLGVPSAALEYAEQSRTVLARRPGVQGPTSENVELASELLAGNAHRALGETAAAAESHALALRFAQNDTTRSQSHLELARDALDGADVKAARYHLARAREYSPEASGMRDLQIDLEAARGQLLAGEDAAAFVQFSALQQKFVSAGAPEFAIDALQAMARIDLRRAKPASALALNQRAIRLLESLRLAIGSPELRARLTALHRSAYEQRVEILDSTYRRDGSRSPNLRAQMFAAADEARAGLVHEIDGRPPAAGDVATQSALRDLMADITLRESRLAAIRSGIASAAGEAKLREELARLRARYDTMIPASSARPVRFDAGEYRFDEVPAGTAILLFIESAGRVQRYVITAGHIEELAVVDTSALAPLVLGATRRSAAQGDAARSSGARREIAQLILPPEPMLSDHPHVIVVASAALADVPFAALPLADGRALIDAHDLTMTLALRDALRIARISDADRRVDLARVAVFFDPVFTPYDTRIAGPKGRQMAFPAVPRLVGTIAEARSIREQLKGVPIDQYSDFAATRENALSARVAGATVLHFATHAIASDQWPNGSGLQLTGFTNRGAPLNGFVSTLDLLSRRSSADLVVLSACDTARGDAAPSESVAGLARAFLGGGALRVVATRRPVEDAVTSLLMREFYAGLAAGHMPSVALSLAQRKTAAIVNDPDAVDWAAFVLYERARGG